MKQKKYIPKIETTINNISKYQIKNINNKYEVIKKVSEKLKEKYLSTEKQQKPIKNIDTGMIIDILKNGINETLLEKLQIENINFIFILYQ